MMIQGKQRLGEVHCCGDAHYVGEAETVGYDKNNCDDCFGEEGEVATQILMELRFVMLMTAILVVLITTLTMIMVLWCCSDKLFVRTEEDDVW